MRPAGRARWHPTRQPLSSIRIGTSDWFYLRKFNPPNTMNAYTDHMTETELREEITRLEKVINDGKATVAQANRLAELRRAAARIREVKYGRFASW